MLIIAPGQGEEANLNYAFEMERSACALFGVVTYGVHMSVYHEEEDGSLRVWVPTRAKSKPTYVILPSLPSLLPFLSLPLLPNHYDHSPLIPMIIPSSSL